jgi:hypothetical protein
MFSEYPVRSVFQIVYFKSKVFERASNSLKMTLCESSSRSLIELIYKGKFEPHMEGDKLSCPCSRSAVFTSIHLLTSFKIMFFLIIF